MLKVLDKSLPLMHKEATLITSKDIGPDNTAALFVQAYKGGTYIVDFNDHYAAYIDGTFYDDVKGKLTGKIVQAWLITNL